MTAEIVAWSTAAGLIVHAIAIIGYLQSRAKSRADIETTATSAKESAREAQRRADEAHEKLALQAAQFALYREQIARDYINRESMREVESRLTTAMREMEARLRDAIEHQGTRLDHAFSGNPPHGPRS